MTNRYTYLSKAHPPPPTNSFDVELGLIHSHWIVSLRYRIPGERLYSYIMRQAAKSLGFKSCIWCWVRWLMLAIAELERLRQEDHWRPQVRPELHSDASSLNTMSKEKQEQLSNKSCFYLMGKSQFGVVLVLSICNRNPKSLVSVIMNNVLTSLLLW